MSQDEYLEQTWEDASALAHENEMLFKKSFAKGFMEGFAEGFEEKKKDIAREMKKMDLPPDKIAFYTDLSFKEVADL